MKSEKAICPMCNGQKILPRYAHVHNGVCFTCQGKGFIEIKNWPVENPMKQFRLDKPNDTSLQHTIWFSEFADRMEVSKDASIIKMTKEKARLFYQECLDKGFFLARVNDNLKRRYKKAGEEWKNMDYVRGRKI